MANKDVIQAIMVLIKNQLSAREFGFGEPKVRPQSYCADLGLTDFTKFVWNQAERLKILPPEVDWIEEEFNNPQIPPTERAKLAATALLTRHPIFHQRLLSLANCADLCGLWVSSLKEGAVLPELRIALKTWTRTRMPPDCLAKICLDDAVTRLADALQGQIDHYAYDQDLFLWMIPLLSQAQIELLLPCRSGINPDTLRPYLHKKTEQILARLSNAFGIYDIEADSVVGRTLLLVIQAPKPIYDAHCNQIEAWALRVLKEQIKLAASFSCQPNMEMRDKWGQKPDIDKLEYAKRAAFLQKFLDLCNEMQ